ncbi:DegT/DnrJ/EryC1/StrS family aminotransferase [Azospirillum isscasi]|uniref:Aminotransferase class I/II-fold pyridoxal phosphate-dependent enzyme n=1 Tax=Azospirillum isscasi TaxID=3053926 RepID=A0ABU0WGK3_9PROT|nr:aminotransferase class I/II-fold pyridoxal phosphate-dependent enzyme [Azospirillum isscasi]MDQ2103341.1 aminotransferase class I/II-fold pyridoxal phosphate-dependent enzyme [Azospirillum isscasi]
MIPVFRPQLPKAAELLPYLKRIDEARWYSNFGPLHGEFRTRIARHYGLGDDQVVLVSNATVGIALALQAVALKRSAHQCICPSWTFAATPHAIALAGQSPVFADVDAATWTLDADQLAEQDIREASGVVMVSPFGAPIDMTKWERFAERNGIPVVCDAAASFDAIGREEFRIGTIPIVISLHATKPLAAAEGCIILCTDPDIIERIRQISNFGFSTTSVAQVLGTNAKLNEYNCAVGLASLDAWPETREKLTAMREYYWERLDEIPGLKVFGRGRSYVSNYMIIETETDGYQLSNHLAQRGIETRRWWRSGCHQHPAFTSFNVKPLPQTRRLGVHTLGLPFYSDLAKTDIDKIVDAVDEFCRPRAA